MEVGRETPPALGGAAVEDTLRLRQFEGFPSQELFSSTVESANVPALFVGAVKGWKAFASWDPRKGGLDYLLEQGGSSTLEAMLSRSAPVFYGDLRSHERVPVQFSTFLAACKLNPIMGSKVGDLTATQDISAISLAHEASDDILGIGKGSNMGLPTVLDSSSPTASEQLYLAQVPILSIENKDGSPLERLSEDIDMPVFLGSKPLVSVNFWMNNTSSRSSTHYDPHHNLLCVVAGCKQVVLWPPSASRYLYPMHVYGEASNHSAVDIQSNDLALHSRAKYSMDYSQKAILHAGDALFIPEGWFHQVDSDDLTIAVNIWWQSNIMTNMLQHMDAYYLRRILNRLVNKEMDQMLCERNSECEGIGNCQVFDKASEDHNVANFCNKKESDWTDEKQGLEQYQMEPSELHALHKIVSVVHDTMNVPGQCKSIQSSYGEQDVNSRDEYMFKEPSAFEDDPIAFIFWTLKPLALQKVFLAMVHNFPRTLEALILHMLSPLAAEVLTRKFDKMDQQTTKTQQSEFYKMFYSVFDEPSAAMNSILNGKESFAFLAFRNVLDQYLGTIVSGQQ